MNVRAILERLARGEVVMCSFTSIPDVDEMRAQIEVEAEAIGLEVVIRDASDPWLPWEDGDRLDVLRFQDYVEAWGVPASSADIRP